NQDLSVDEAFKRLENTHRKMIRQFESLQQEQLFTHNFFNWTGSSTLGDYASLFSAERYEWAIRRLQHFRHDLAQKPLVTQ
ncbi:ClbS/DfsB family four-helix bundle protein, partial [Staphylococcus epidermidis]